MKTKYLISFFVTCLLAVGFSAFAQALDNIQYPVAQLGNCNSESACKTYCDKPENTDKCFAFAKENGLMSQGEINTAKKFLVAKDAPGDCKNREECNAYCEDMNHMDECIAFAEKNNLMTNDELQEAKKMQVVIARGVKPPPCGNNKKACDAYCENPDHMQECITFGIEAGFIQGKELEDSQKMLQALKKGVKPPPCKGKEACDEYCSNPDNIEVCMNFAMEAGFMSEEEKANSQKMIQAIRKGVKPPPCKGKDECDAYCQSEEHMQECINFSVAAGMMTEKDAEMAKKTGGKGPGGCKDKNECETFCNNSDNQETCFNFSKDNGMIPEEDLKRMEDGKQQMKQTLEQAPAETIECLKTELGSDMVEKMKNGVMPSRDLGDKMQGCWEKTGPIQGPGEGGDIPAGRNCQGEDCKNFQPGPGTENPGGQMMPRQAGPGGCKTPEECQKFCETNPEQCKNTQQNMQPGDRQVPKIEVCQGEDCKNFQPGPNQTNPGGQMQQGQPCQGENCQVIAPQNGQQPGDQQQIMGPPNQPGTQPGSGGNMTPGEFVPQIQVQPSEQPQQQTPPNETPLPPPPTSFFMNPDSLVASVITSFINLLSRR